MTLCSVTAESCSAPVPFLEGPQAHLGLAPALGGRVPSSVLCALEPGIWGLGEEAGRKGGLVAALGNSEDPTSKDGHFSWPGGVELQLPEAHREVPGLTLWAWPWAAQMGKGKGNLGQTGPRLRLERAESLARVWPGEEVALRPLCCQLGGKRGLA